MEERIKELEDMWDMIHNYEIIETTIIYFYTPYKSSRRYDNIQHVKYIVFVRRTEYSKIIRITYNTYNDEITKKTIDDYKNLSNNIDYYDIFMVKNAIAEQLYTKLKEVEQWSRQNF